MTITVKTYSLSLKLDEDDHSSHFTTTFFYSPEYADWATYNEESEEELEDRLTSVMLYGVFRPHTELSPQVSRTLPRAAKLRCQCQRQRY